ncbi:hypothetical protein MY892_00165 [Haemophilus influenzae]|nr:hypothetical protein [Haemophilus influenzae]MCK8898142.1 hypothetical protein [Haemophilus influenzae]MCK8933400.1 hypothetical protein [Haemophilus influenzae]MCK9020189.1 hypothetical protein [Haemophilus influenzae]MCK9039860.1 hypothetical protein [Haemophilus influenzae]MCK9042444.1 hypothetical protein [Haemophilus influenzae]
MSSALSTTAFATDYQNVDEKITGEPPLVMKLRKLPIPLLVM